jgi:hypothetical protein
MGDGLVGQALRDKLQDFDLSRREWFPLRSWRALTQTGPSLVEFAVDYDHAC